ncbi:class I SAM-dependent methyltransferase [Pseudomonas lini]|uniref:class I SAM-dependent methyltransferase n=1 Tax=Pseudomonas lini TaxID=163011 RepID=UPI00345E9C50
MNSRAKDTPKARELSLAKNMANHITCAGPISCFVEPPGNGLHQVFLLRVRGCDWVGRKVLQRDQHHRWGLSSILIPAMLLGPHRQSQWGNEGVSIYFQASTEKERTEAFETALTCPDSEIHFPFAVTDDSGQEAVCPSDYWQGNESLAALLNADELHFREHCVTVLRTLLKPGDLVYDPACSTGEFIAHLATELADGRYLGTDRSTSMIEYAQQRHSASSVEFRVMEATTSTESNIRCEVLILRFLNAEVMTRRQAHCAFESLVRCVKPDGTILVFGHSPVLLALPWLAHTFALAIICSVSARTGCQELFQFYRLTVPTV